MKGVKKTENWRKTFQAEVTARVKILRVKYCMPDTCDELKASRVDKAE